MDKSWQTSSSFYADTNGIIDETGAVLYNKEATFFCECSKTTFSFEAINVLALEHAKKEKALDYILGKTDKLRMVGSLPSLFCDSVDVIELEDGSMIFLKLKGTEFKQMLKIAASKQKYSREVYLRSKSR